MKLDKDTLTSLARVITQIGEEMDTRTLDDVVKKWRDKYAEYKEVDAKAKALYGEAAILQGELLDMLGEAGKSKYFVEGLGTVYTQTTRSRSMPKDPKRRKEFLEYLRKKHGKDFFFNTVSVYAQSLNAYCREEEANGVSDFPGLDEAKERTEVRFRKG